MTRGRRTPTQKRGDPLPIGPTGRGRRARPWPRPTRRECAPRRSSWPVVSATSLSRLADSLHLPRDASSCPGLRRTQDLENQATEATSAGEHRPLRTRPAGDQHTPEGAGGGSTDRPRWPHGARPARNQRQDLQRSGRGGGKGGDPVLGTVDSKALRTACCLAARPPHQHSVTIRP
jgi:hypothetical protein